jgi:phosphatidylserine decarboxylase
VVLNLAGAAFWPWAGLLLLPLTAWCIAFFRDPERRVPAGAGLVVCPADGRLLPVIAASPPEELGLGRNPLTRLSIFMDVFNVHVNRIPADGVVTALAYRPGKFFNASFDKASVHNERTAVRLTLDGAGEPKRELALVQIAGLVARRIRCDLKEGQRVCRGDRFGIIRFGSRVDVYLPDGARVRVHAGQKVKAGETVLADFPR